MEKQKSIFDLPEEFLIKMLKYLRRSDLLNVRLVCRKFCYAASHKGVLDIQLNYPITLRELIGLFKHPLILSSLTKLKLMQESDNKWLTLEYHMEPMKLVCCSLRELYLDGLILRKEVTVNNLPLSLRRLELNKVTFENDDDDFFLCERKECTTKLEELRLVSTDISCFALLRCFGSSLKALYLKDISNFSDLHFSHLKWELDRLESLQIHSCYNITEDVLKTARTFQKLKYLTLGDSNCKATRWRIDGFKDFSKLYFLESLEIQNLEIWDDLDQVPILPSLKSVRICFATVDYISKFCFQISATFPFLICLYLSAVETTNLSFLALESLGTHPSLTELYLGGFRILNLDSVDETVERPSSRVHTLGFWNCIVTYEVSLLICQCFTRVIDLWIYFCTKVPVVVSIAGMFSGMKKLVCVKLLGPGITDSFLDAVITRIPKNVEGLFLGDDNYESAVTNYSLKTVALNLTYLTALTVVSSNVTFNGLFELCKLKHLVKFDLKSPHITEDQLERIKELLSFLKVGI